MHQHNTDFNQNQEIPYAMPYEEHMHYRDYHGHHMHDFCKKYKHYYVMMEMDDGKMYDGIIEKADNDHAYVLMPIGDQREENIEEDRQYGYGGYGYPYGGYGPGYGYGHHIPFRFRRFRRFRFPFFRIRRFSFPFPY